MVITTSINLECPCLISCSFLICHIFFQSFPSPPPQLSSPFFCFRVLSLAGNFSLLVLIPYLLHGENALQTAHFCQHFTDGFCTIIKVQHTQAGYCLNCTQSTKRLFRAVAPYQATETFVLILGRTTKTPFQQLFACKPDVSWFYGLKDSIRQRMMMAVIFFCTSCLPLPSTPGL